MYDERNPIARWAGPPVRWMQIACGWALLAICFATLYDILARRMFAHSVQGVTELGAYLLAIVSAFGFSSALLQKAHSRVDFLFPRIPPFIVSVLNLLAAMLLFGVAAISVWQGWHVLEESLLFDSRGEHAAADADVDSARAVARRACGICGSDVRLCYARSHPVH